MKIDAKMEDGACTVRIEGEMTIYNAVEMKNGLEQCLKGTGDINVDLSEVSELDSSGVQLLLLAGREAQRRERSFRITSHSRPTRSVYELYNLADVFGDAGT